MKKILLALALLWPSGAWAQCTGVFPANTLCGNLSGTPQPPAAFSSGGTIAGPVSSTSGDIVTFTNSVGSMVGDPATIITSQSVNLTGVTSLAQTNVTSLNVLSQFFYHGNGITFPASGSVGLLGTNQVWTGGNSFSTAAVSTLTVTGTLSAATPVSPSSGGTGSSTISAHGVMVGEGTAQINAPVGTNAQCLSGNTGADPTFNGGCWVLLSSTPIVSGSAAVSDFTHLTSTISDYEIVLENVVPASGNAILILQVHAAGALQSTAYSASSTGITTATGGTLTAFTSTGSIPLTGRDAIPLTGPGASGLVRLYTPVNSTAVKMVSGQFTTMTSATPVVAFSAGAWTTTTSAVDGFAILANIGNLASGVVKLYGRQ